MAVDMVPSVVDVHAHFWDLKKQDPTAFNNCKWPVLVTSQTEEEAGALAEFTASWLWRSVGVHPQATEIRLLDTLDQHLASGRFSAIGEFGFDFSSPEQEKQQRELFEYQIQLAKKYQLPIILHVRRGTMAQVYSYRKLLRFVPAVVFHCYSCSYTDALIMLRANVNAYFSFGTPLLWGARNPNVCLRQLALDRIFLETDAPFQPVRSDTYTALPKIYDLYTYAAMARGISYDELKETLFKEFLFVFDRELYRKLRE